MKSLNERIEETLQDPSKLKKVFTIAWIVAYSMLILGFIIILWILFMGQ